ncbi:MAG TPA: DUF1302 family protein [Candidatus Binataceae bacterium]|nr:DUF1302 family protein [Candidatus Binataceae bacterium]
MKKRDRLKFMAAMGIAAALVMYAGAGAWAQLDTDVPLGHVKIQTALETDWGVHTAGKDNRNNNNNHIPGSGQGFSTDGNDLQYAVGRIDPLMTFRTRDDVAQEIGLDNLDLYLHLRYWGDAAQLVNGPRTFAVGQGAYASPGIARYPGDGWSARISEHEYEAEANEAYIDLRKGPFALRLGKQQVVYGEELGVQTLDQVDSLDFTKFQTFEIGALEYSDVRIGEWTAKASYQLPDFTEEGVENSLITGFVSPDFQPDYFVGLGTQLNDEPAAEPIGDYGNLRRARNKLVYGAVASTTVYGVDLTANFYATPDHVGWFALAPTGLTPDNFAGQPFLGPGHGLFDFNLQRRFSRDFIYGGSASYTVPTLDFPGAEVLNGDIFHFSAAYTPHKTFWTATSIAAPPNVIKPTRIGEINWTIDAERYLRWSQSFPSMYLLGEWNYKSRSTVISDIYEPALGHKAIHTVVLSLTQFFPNNIWGTSIEAVCDTNVGGNWFMQPSVTYKPTSSQEYDVYWNFDEGTNVHPGVGGIPSTNPTGSKLGSFDFMDAIFFRAVYKM